MEAQPPRPVPPPASQPRAATPQQGPGEFTRLFQAPPYGSLVNPTEKRKDQQTRSEQVIDNETTILPRDAPELCWTKSGKRQMMPLDQ